MGRIICVGLGPGDPDLMSLRAHRLVSEAQHVAYFRKAGRPGQARRIVEGLLRLGCAEYPMEYPVTTELPFNSPDYISQLTAFYDDWAERLAELAREEEVIVLCEGDPFFYGSFMHLHVRLRGRAEVEVVPGITGMSGCWTATGAPITWSDDVLTVLTGILPESELARRMRDSDALVVMKTGRNLPKIRRALNAAGRLEQAWLVAHGTTRQQRVLRLAEMPEEDCPYFAIVLVHGQAPA
jgi:precorrin-2/cobalt-factor-2 C20-methyltransferase